jgi:hypothetical protein
MRGGYLVFVLRIRGLRHLEIIAGLSLFPSLKTNRLKCSYGSFNCTNGQSGKREKLLERLTGMLDGGRLLLPELAVPLSGVCRGEMAGRKPSELFGE